MIDTLLVLIGITGLSIASIIDLKTHEIPDWLNFSMIASGISLRLMQAVSSFIWKPFLYTILAALAMLILGSLMYYTKQWGGGDTKLLIAIASIFTITPKDNFFLYNVLINLVIISTFYGIAWCVYFAVKQRNKLVKELPLYFRKNKSKILQFTIAALLIFAVSMAFKTPSLSILLITISSLMFLYPFLTTFIEAVERSAMFKEVKVSRLVEGDWITKDIRVKNKLIYSMSSPGIERHQITLLKKSGIKYVPVKDGIPFVPSFLITIMLTLLYGNLILFLL
ncbi:prepilin peptidase [Candidatus Woesearchaeota archaeon]|nr:prepilin peptidase [Candidatus Woesearchaeota archaeon]